MKANRSVEVGRWWRLGLTVMALSGVLALSGCGQKGPLKLPPPPASLAR
ncbi:MAG: LPS translocon maturation chaperone LptM [Inhella sp.]|nr:lipoprotein [Inhella sp.]MCZ8234691.1 lipoprotein [Inhella sp.]